jgi:hypothetical protein
MLGSRVIRVVAVFGVLAVVFATAGRAEAGLRHRCCLPVCRPLPCPVVVVVPVRVMPVPVMVAQPPCMLPVLAPPAQPGFAPPPRVVVKKYKITKIRYKVPKKNAGPSVPPSIGNLQPTPVVHPPVVCPPVICPPVICPPVVCCPVPVICPPVCIPKRWCPIRSCR